MKKISHSMLVMIVFIALSCTTHHGSYDITDFGAKGDGKTINTKEITKAIEACNRYGGGEVKVPAGVFLSGTIKLLSNVTLHLSAGAVLKGSSDTSDYYVQGRRHGLIYAEDAENITITGFGEINGNGTCFHDSKIPHVSKDFDTSFTRQGAKFMNPALGFEDGPIEYKHRPGMMIVFSRCENISIKDVTIKDSPEWTIRISGCDNVVVSGIDIINNPLIPNNDGIHCPTSRNVRISDCYIATGDDGIIVTGFEDEIDVNGAKEKLNNPRKFQFGNHTGFAENVTVSNCVIQSRSAGIRIGYGNNSIRNCTFQNLIITNSNRGIGIFSRDRGSIENINFSDIRIETRLHKGHWWGKGEPVHVSAIAENPGINPGKIRNISFQNVTMKSETGIVVYGDSTSTIEDLNFSTIKLQIVPSKLAETYGGNFDLRPTKSPETQIFKHDIPGFYARNVQNMIIRNFELQWGTGLANYFTNGFYCENFENLLIDGFHGRQALLNSTDAAIVLRKGKGVNIMNCIADRGTGTFLNTEAIEDAGLFINNNLSKAGKSMGNRQENFTFSGNKLK
jgi:polygalacturonase